MEKITVDEKNKRRIQKYIEAQETFLGYDEDINLLDKENKLTEKLARPVFTSLMNDANRIRNILTSNENGEFEKQIQETYYEYDKIPKPEELKKDGFYDGLYKYMSLEEVYSNMQIAFKMIELDKQYYECRDIRNIADTVINSINGIEKYKIELGLEEKEELEKIKEELRNLLEQSETDVKSIQDRVDIYNTYAINIWNAYLTDVNSTQNDEYRWLVHNLSKGPLEGEFRDKYMSTSLITNNMMGLYGSANYGLIIKPKHIVSASYGDTYTFNYKDEDIFINKPPILLPQEIEETCIRKTIEANGEMLNYEKKPIYPEIVVDEYEIEGIYYISYGEKELARDYKKAKNTAEKRGIPLVERDISKYRVQHGLEPMTESAKKSFCGNILRICCDGDKQLQEAFDIHYHTFVEAHYQELYKKYMELKQKGDCSTEDILKEFSKISRNGQFSKIFEKINQFYLKADEEENQLNGKNEKDIKQEEIQMPQIESNQWMNRFKFWYGAIDRVSKSVKPKFITIKLDIVNEMNDIMHRDISKEQQRTN